MCAVVVTLPTGWKCTHLPLIVISIQVVLQETIIPSALLTQVTKASSILLPCSSDSEVCILKDGGKKNKRKWNKPPKWLLLLFFCFFLKMRKLTCIIDYLPNSAVTKDPEQCSMLACACVSISETTSVKNSPILDWSFSKVLNILIHSWGMKGTARDGCLSYVVLTVADM